MVFWSELFWSSLSRPGLLDIPADNGTFRSWEMSTIGHPLSDLANALMPFFFARTIKGPPDTRVPHAQADFLPGATPGLPTPSRLAAIYASAAGLGDGGWDGMEQELKWTQAFSTFRLSAICQGIAARAATKQASSAKAEQHAIARASLAEFAWVLAQEFGKEQVKGKRLKAHI